MGVMMQAFYWNCPQEEHRTFGWWNHLRTQIPALSATGFTHLWLPPVHKAANIGGPSMGYDPYDYYDLGEFNQKGHVSTLFGTRVELDRLIAAAHDHRLGVLADMVITHNSGGDATESNPITGEERWTVFAPRSGKFHRDWNCFHPCTFDRGGEQEYGEMPALSHRNPYVLEEIFRMARWLVEDVGFDGFRYDFARGYTSWTIGALQQYHYMRDGHPYRPFGVGHCWCDGEEIDRWVGVANAFNDNPVNAFDIPLQRMLKALCDDAQFDLRRLTEWNTLTSRQPERSVTFVENHDMRDDATAIVNDKLLAYAWILTHEGYPCVYWKDYVTHRLALEDTPNGIAALVSMHEAFAGGATRVLRSDEDLYIMERSGHDTAPGLLFVLNNRSEHWHGAWVRTGWENTRMAPVAWWSAGDVSRPDEQWTSSHGDGGFWAPPRGYAVYVPAE